MAMNKLLIRTFWIFIFLGVIACSHDDSSEPLILSSEKKILSFQLPIDGAYVEGSINQEDNIISFNTTGQELNGLKPKITYSEKARISPSESAAQNFSTEIAYTVYAEDGSTAVYRVNVNNRQLSTEKQILSFVVKLEDEDVEAVINEDEKEIYIDVGSHTNDFETAITISEKATIERIGDSFDYTKPIEYKVTAEDGSYAIYELQVNKPNIDGAAGWVERLLFFPGAEVIVSGKFLDIDENTTFYLENSSGTRIFPQITKKESYTDDFARTEMYITFMEIPDNAPTGIYRLVVEINGYTLTYDNFDILNEEVPRVSSSEKTEYHLNDTLVLHGTNLKPYIMIPDNGSRYLIFNTGSVHVEVNEDKTELRFVMDYHYDQFFWPEEVKNVYLMDEDRRIGESIELLFK
ncbi:MAG: hypothetical protein ABGW91_01455 [Christiangramia sp.]